MSNFTCTQTVTVSIKWISLRVLVRFNLFCVVSGANKIRQDFYREIAVRGDAEFRKFWQQLNKLNVVNQYKICQFLGGSSEAANWFLASVLTDRIAIFPFFKYSILVYGLYSYTALMSLCSVFWTRSFSCDRKRKIIVYERITACK